MEHRYRVGIVCVAAALVGGLLLTAAWACGGDGPLLLAPGPLATSTAEAAGVLDLERFHYVASLTLREQRREGSNLVVSTEGDFQSPDRHAFTYTRQLRGVTARESAVVIGDQVWLRDGDGQPWREAALVDPQATNLFAVAFSPIRPGFLGGPEFRQAREAVRRLPSALEFVNEVRAHHYQVGAEGEQYFRSFLADEQLLQQVRDLRWDLWLAQEGAWPVRLLASGTVTGELQILQDLGLTAPATWELRIDVSRPNDPALAVVAPGP